MRCKYLLLYGLLAVLPFSAQAGYKKIANGILVSLPEGELNQSKTVRLLVVNDEVIQVTASPEAKIQDKQSLVRVVCKYPSKMECRIDFGFRISEYRQITCGRQSCYGRSDIL